MDETGGFHTVYNPDVLTCLANLSNDEVFTPPEVACAMLDLLPREIFTDPSVTFLDPACKSGVFLREAAKRLIAGLEGCIPDLQERIDHILHKQLYGIAITELTGLLSRRSLYCSKYPNGTHSVSRFEDEQGNIRYRETDHSWRDGKCIYCQTSQRGRLSDRRRGEGLEAHAYEFIHTASPEELMGMSFDVIIGNPPYQLSTAGDDNGAQAKPVYHKFIEQAKKLNPRYLLMIIPSRWFSGGWGLDEFRDAMMSDRSIRELHDFPDASDCFPGVEIKGGVCYFLRDRLYDGPCRFVTHRGERIVSGADRFLREPGCDIVIRLNEAIPILHKVAAMGEETFDSIVSTKKPFGFITNYKGMKRKPSEDGVKLYANRRIEYVRRSEIHRNREAVDRPKVIVPKAVGSGDGKTDVIRPLYCEPGACCTETYLLVGPFDSREIAEHVMEYMGTRFFHFLVTLQKNTQDCMRRVYSFVPMQDFGRAWTDEELYEKYGLTEEEIAYIEASVWPDRPEENADEKTQSVRPARRREQD